MNDTLVKEIIFPPDTTDRCLTHIRDTAHSDKSKPGLYNSFGQNIHVEVRNDQNL